ncbi:MAG: hypothetical protein IKM08_00030, partial [Clostridia bacterium]|nr:hypothetical protein [Clostridia bacterium]
LILYSYHESRYILSSSFRYQFHFLFHSTYSAQTPSFVSAIVLRQIHIYRSVYRQFRLCITKASGKAHTPNVERIQRLSLRESSRDSG